MKKKKKSMKRHFFEHIRKQFFFSQKLSQLYPKPSSPSMHRDSGASSSALTDRTVSLQAFCNMAGIFIHEDSKKNVFAHTTQEPRIENGQGIFQSSQHSLFGSGNFATTYAMQPETFTPGFRKKRVDTCGPKISHVTEVKLHM